jgi:integrase/recombinase XerD
MTPPSAKTPPPTDDYAVRPPCGDDPPENWQLIAPDGQPVPDAHRLLRAAALRGLRPSTLRTYAYDLLCAYRWMRQDGQAPHSLNSDNLLEFIAYQKQPPPTSPTTINRRLELIQRLSAMVTHRPLPAPRAPRRGRRSSAVRVRTEHRLVTPLTDRAALTFFETLHTARDRAIVLAMWIAGLRSCEIIQMELADVDFQTMSLKARGKGRKERMLPLAEPLAKAMLYYLNFERPARASSRLFVVLKGPRRGKPMTYTGLHRIFRYHRATSRIANANPHRFRHSFGANMTRCRVPLAILAAMMGHSSPQTTLRYIQLNDEDIRHQYDQALQTLTAQGLLNHRSVACNG